MDKRVQAWQSKDVPQPPSRAKPLFIILLGFLTAFDPLSIDMYLPALPDIQRSLHVSYALVELSLSFFFIGLALGQLIYGPLADRFGRKKPLFLGMSVYVISSIACVFATNIRILILCRVLQALGGCSGMVVTRAIVRDLFDKREAAVIFSMLVLVMGAAPVLAPLIGGYVNRFWGWQMIFLLLAGIGMISLFCVWRFLPETLPPERRRSNVWSLIKEYGHLVKDRSFVGYSLAGAGIRADMFSYIAGSPFVFIELYHVRSDHYGWIFGANAFGLIASSQLNSYLLRKIPLERILRASLFLAATAGLILVLVSFWQAPLWVLLVPLFFFLINMGFVGPNTVAAALSGQGHRAGLASSLLGGLQWSLAFFASLLVSAFHNGTSLPMSGLVCLFGWFALSIYFLLVRDA